MAQAEIVVGAVIAHGNSRVVAARQAVSWTPGGRWRFPGGSVEPGETDAEALVRTCDENLGWTVRVLAEVGRNVGDGELRLLHAECLDDNSGPRRYEYCEWLPIDDFDSVPWLPQDRALLGTVRRFVGALDAGLGTEEPGAASSPPSD